MPSLDELQDGRRHYIWNKHKEYLHDKTPLTEQQATILALARVHATPTQIATLLDIEEDTVNKHWNRIKTTVTGTRELDRVVGDQSLDYDALKDYSEHGDNPPLWQWPWERHATVTYTDDSTTPLTEVTLDLYVDDIGDTLGPSFLLVEMETVEKEKWLTETTVRRSVHGQNGLRGYIYKPADTPFEWAVRWTLLEQSGIDPGADGTPNPATQVGNELGSEKMELAMYQAREQVEVIE